MQALQSPGRLKQAADHGVLKWVNGVHDYNAVSPAELRQRLDRCGKFGLDWYYVTLRPEYADHNHATLKLLLETARRYRGRTKVRWWLELTTGREELVRDPGQLKAIVDLVGAENVVVSDNELRIDPAASGAREVCRLWYWKFRKPQADGLPAWPEQVAVERPSMYPVHQLAVFAERHASLGVRLNCTVASFGTWEMSRPPRAGWDNYLPMLEQDHLFNWYVLAAMGVHRIFIYSVPDAAGREYHDQTLAAALESFRTGQAPKTSAGWPPAPLFAEPLAVELRAARQRVEQLESALEKARSGDLNGDGKVDHADVAILQRQIERTQR